jgi:hypothetical protein
MSQHKEGIPWDKAYRNDYERTACDLALLHDPEGRTMAIPYLLWDLTVHLQAIEERQEQMEQMLELIVKTIAEGSEEGEDEEDRYEQEDNKGQQCVW